MKAFFLKNQRVRRIAFFFPFQLLFVHLKKNHLIMLFWLILFGIVTEVLAPKYGIPLLFLNPEYLDNVGFWSYFIVGFSCGGFIMAFNMSSYILNGFRFPFLATLANPFLKYCLNNLIIPGSFILVYTYKIIVFQHKNQAGFNEITSHLTAFYLGIFAFLFISITYFFSRSKDIYKMFGVKEIDNNIYVDLSKKEERDWHVETYFSQLWKIKLTRRYDHYDKQMLRKVFRQNHYTAATFEIIAVVSLIIFGSFREIPIFMIPAGASLFLLFTMFLMLASALHTWLRGWSTTAFIAIVLIVNFIFQVAAFDNRNKAYGLDYENKKNATFTLATLADYQKNYMFYDEDIKNTLEILTKWKLKNQGNSSQIDKKPKIVFINTSGGGLRSSLWTFHVLQYADSLLNGELLNHSALITGSSGGMVGAAYMRELYLRKQQKKISTIYNDNFLYNIGKDLLNPIAFTIAVNDLFFRFQHFEVEGKKYTKDRAYAFEKKLNENTNQVLNKKLKDYTEPEKQALIPIMVFSPTIINDGRKLLIASQPISYLVKNNSPKNLNHNPLHHSIEFSRFFSQQDAKELHFTSALRMNATFPYIMPVVALPSVPSIEVMDAGIRDNFGVETSIKFLYVFREWIEENTSGAVFIQIRDRHKEFPVEDNPRQSITGALARPLGTFYGNTFHVQDFNQTQLMEYASQWFKGPIEVIDFQLRNMEDDNISLSWHLTEHEKEKILKSVYLKENLGAIERLRELLEE